MRKLQKISLLIAIIFISSLIIGVFTVGVDGSQIYNNETIIKTSIHDQPIQFFTPDDDDAGTGDDAGDSFAFATPITEGQYNGTLTVADNDYYRFSVGIGVIINITMSAHNLTMNFDVTLYAQDSTYIKHNPKEAGFQESILWSAGYSGNYSMLINSAVSDYGNYSFGINLIPQNDFGTGNDAGNDITSPITIFEGSSNGTMVRGSDEWDFYDISLDNGEIINIDLEWINPINIDLSLHDIDGSLLYSSTKLIGFNESIYAGVSVSGDYKIAITINEVTVVEEIIPYNLTVLVSQQNDGNSGTDAGNRPEDAFQITPLRDSIFNGKLILNGDKNDYYTFTKDEPTLIYMELVVPDTVNFDLYIYDNDRIEIYSSQQDQYGAKETIWAKSLQNGTYYINVEFVEGDVIEADYVLNIGLIADNPVTTTDAPNLTELIPLIVAAVLIPIFIIVVIILVLYIFTDVKIPWLSKKLDDYFGRRGKSKSAKDLRYALRVRDNTISSLREDLIEKDAKRAKDLETVHRLEEDQKANTTVIDKIRVENSELKTHLNNLEAVNNDLANIIDSTIRRQLSKSSKPALKAKITSITSLLWLSEERLAKYIESVPLLNERYIMDKNKNFILTREFARELVRQSYWKRVGAMHLKKIKQVKVSALAEDTNIDIPTVKEILRELVERKEIPAPIHMDRVSLLLSISEELISELSDITQNTPIISLKDISKSFDTTVESAKVIFKKIAEEGYAQGEFINEDTFVVYNLLRDLIIKNGSTDIIKLTKRYNLIGAEEDIKILIEKMIQANDIEGKFITDNLFLAFNNLNSTLKHLVNSSIDDINKGDTRKMVFDVGSVVESIVKERLMPDIHEVSDTDKIPQYQDAIESRELGRIVRAADDAKITMPAHIELKSLNRFWASKIKHTKPGELPYIPSDDEAKEFLFEANKALNVLTSQKISSQWKEAIASKLLREKKKDS
ncbi:MAG: PPC domain-containing protein [Candidatus Heimdallarchaeota archaeon]